MKFILLISLLIIAKTSWSSEIVNEDLAELKIKIGEKLFLDDRFSKSFKLNSTDPNTPTVSGDKNLDETFLGFLEGKHPNQGKNFSCSTCHLVDQGSTDNFPLVFTYNDNLSLAPVPFITEKSGHTLRNSSNLVGTMLGPKAPLHWDGEYFSSQELTCHSLTGPNMGWKLSEHREAVVHISNIISSDNGKYHEDFDQSYSEDFKKLNIDIGNMSKHKVFHLACEFITIYMEDLNFAQDEDGKFNGSAFDQFLSINNIKQIGQDKPKKYITYLLSELERPDLKFIQASPLKYHEKPSQFTELELQGLKVFSGRGQCIQCHTPPLFTDSGFHNVGTSQTTYEKIHGYDQFKKIKTPTFKEKITAPEFNNFPTFIHPSWQSTNNKNPIKNDPRFIDLGLWNNVGHPDKKHNQELIKKEICKTMLPVANCETFTDNDYLEFSFAAFKTPTLRSLGQSAPYFHDGSAKDLTKVLTHYSRVFHREHHGQIKNADPRLGSIRIGESDIKALVAFLEALNEDYD